MKGIDAYDEITHFLAANDGEKVDGIMIGYWRGYTDWEPHSTARRANDEDPGFAPFEIQGKVLTLFEAEPFMHGWRWRKPSYGSSRCYYSTVWTTNLVLIILEYDGTTWVSRVDRNPTPMKDEG